MQEFLQNPFYYWGAIVGLFMASVILISSGVFMIATSFKVMNVVRMKDYKKSMAQLLEEIYYKNHALNPEVAKVAATLLLSIDPARAAVLTSMAEVGRGDRPPPVKEPKPPETE